MLFSTSNTSVIVTSVFKTTGFFLQKSMSNELNITCLLEQQCKSLSVLKLSDEWQNTSFAERNQFNHKSATAFAARLTADKTTAHDVTYSTVHLEMKLLKIFSLHE